MHMWRSIDVILNLLDTMFFASFLLRKKGVKKQNQNHQQTMTKDFNRKERTKPKACVNLT